MGLFSLSEITDKAQSAFKRFPVTLIWAILGTIVCLVLVEDRSGKLFDEYSNLFLTSLLGVSWLIGTRFLIEQTTKPKKWAWLKVLVLLLLFAFYLHLPKNFDPDDHIDFFLRFFLYLIAGHLFVFFAPFLFKWDKEAYWNYLKITGMAIIRSAFFSGVLFLGLVLALAAIDALFDVNINGKRYGQLFIFCLGIVNTWIYLSDFPENIQSHKTIRFNKALEVFVKYILIPLVILYLIILYAYSIKILIEWELPKGWVSYLVTALALLGFVVQIIINPIQKTIRAWTIRIFHPFFYIMLLPLVVLLFIAIFRRVSDYGITENRYFVIVLAFWILGMAIYLLFFKNRRLIILPISLFFLATLSSFGYWGAINVAMRSQTAQFEKVFNMVRANKNIASGKQYEQLRSILNYMNDRSALSELDPITEIDTENRLTNTAGKKSYWFDAHGAIDSLGISLHPGDTDSYGQFGKSYSYYNNDHNTTQTYAIGNFDYFAAIQLNQYSQEPVEMGEVFVEYDKTENALLFKNNSDSVNVFQLSLREKLLDLTKYNSHIPEESIHDLVMNFENERILGKLIFTDLNYNIKNDSITLNHSRVYLFVKHL